ncbi:MAG: DUF502 domain-containing protein [Firmicutes bacterium]|nr:DUF502 domain-containing protein [Bacillota bacterium]
MAGTIMRRMRTYLLAGLIVLIPAVGTLYIAYLIFRVVDGWLGSHLIGVFGLFIPGAGLIATLAIIMFVGLVATNFIGKRLIGFGDRIMSRIPIIRGLYGTIKQLTDAMFMQNSSLFKKVVLVEYPRKGIYSVGLLTGNGAYSPVRREFDSPMVPVFLPSTPNPTTGWLIYVPREDLVELDISVEDGLKLIISGGVVAPNNVGRASEAKATLRDTAK